MVRKMKRVFKKREEKRQSVVEKFTNEIVSGVSNREVLQNIVEYTRKTIGFDAYVCFEVSAKNKVSVVSTDFHYEQLVRLKEKCIKENIEKLARGEDIISKIDRTVYHPVIIDKCLCYIWVYEEVNLKDHHNNLQAYMELCSELKVLMGILQNKVLRGRAMITDRLTGMYNEYRLREDIQKHIDSQVVFLLIKTNVSEIKKTLGIEIMENVIKSIAERFDKVIKRDEKVYRYNEDTFAMLLFGSHENLYDTIVNIKATIETEKVVLGNKDVEIYTTIAATELKYLDDKTVWNVYKNTEEILKRKPGDICFVGQRFEEKETKEPEEAIMTDAAEICTSEDIEKTNDKPESSKKDESEKTVFIEKEEVAENVKETPKKQTKEEQKQEENELTSKINKFKKIKKKNINCSNTVEKDILGMICN